MNLAHHRILAIAATCTLLSLPVLAQASPSDQSQASAGVASSESAGALHLVPATALLLDTLDAKKLEPGAGFTAKLNTKVHLANGTELPAGTVLHGAVTSDDMNLQGTSKLALQFTTAQLKDGQSVPIKAAIVGLYFNDGSEDAYNGWADWNKQTEGVEQLDAMSGVDLHSKIDSQNSGVFVTTRKDDVKLGRGSNFSLAIAAEPGAQTNPAASSGN
jgi:hypothetical protein